jgi:hypothetical protein
MDVHMGIEGKNSNGHGEGKEENMNMVETVIIEKSCTTLHAMVEKRHQFQQQLVHLKHQNQSKRHKTIHLVQKLKCANSPKEVCALCIECAGQHSPNCELC